MSGEKFTDGPWSYRPVEGDDWGVVRCANGTIVAIAKAGRYVDNQQARMDKTDPCEGNGNLIATAPDLYAFLEKIMRGLDKGHIVSGDGDSYELWVEAEYILAKARGES